jgi:hypothetical protein
MNTCQRVVRSAPGVPTPIANAFWYSFVFAIAVVNAALLCG